jgi:hypothetical protein
MPIGSFAALFTGLDPWYALMPAFSTAGLPLSSSFTQTPAPQDTPPQDHRRQCAPSGDNASTGPTGIRQKLKRHRQDRDSGTGHRKTPPKRAYPVWYARDDCPL